MTAKSAKRIDPVAQAVNLCRQARSLERQGKYERAREILSGYFPERIGDEPSVEGLDLAERGEVFLRCGVIMQFYASAKAIAEGQAEARKLLDYARGLFEVLSNRDKESEALTAIAVTHWREGSIEEADRILHLSEIRAAADEPKALALINHALLLNRPETCARARRYLEMAAPYIPEENHYVAGIYYNTLATTSYTLGEQTGDAHHYQIALIHSAGAIAHFEALGHRRYLARAVNVSGVLLLLTNQYEQAEAHLRRALRLAEALKDQTLAGQVCDSLAKLFNLMPGRRKEAERFARRAIRLLEGSGESGPLAEAYRTLSEILYPQPPFDWESFSLGNWLRREEKRAIARAISESDGEIASVAQMLGLIPEAFADRLETDYPELEELLESRRASERAPRA